MPSTIASAGVSLFDLQVRDLVAEVAVDVLKGDDDLVTFSQLRLQSRETRARPLLLRGDCHVSLPPRKTMLDQRHGSCILEKR